MSEQILSLVVDTSKMLPRLDKCETALKSLGMTALKVGAVLTAAISVPMYLFGKAAIDAAGDATEADSKFQVVFSDVAQAANAAAADISKNFGLATLTTQELLSNTGDLLVGFGMAQKEALKMSEQVNRLAIDLASFKNVTGGAERASEAITKAMLGEREALKGIGIAINEDDIKQLAKDRGIVGEINRQTKAILTLDLVMMRSKNAIGDYERTQYSFANASKRLTQRLIDLKVAVGSVLIDGLKLDVVFDFMGIAVKSIADSIKGFSPLMKTITAIGAVLTGIAPVVLTIAGGMLLFASSIAGAIASVATFVIGAGGLAAIISSVGAAVAAAIPIILPVAGIIIGIGVAMAATAAVVIDNWGMISSYVMSAINVIIPSTDGLGDSFKTVGEVLKWFGSIITDYISPILGGAIVAGLAFATQQVLMFKVAWNVVSAAIRGAVYLIVGQIELLFRALSWAMSKLPGLSKTAEALNKSLDETIGKTREALGASVVEDINDIGDAFAGMGKNATNAVGAIAGVGDASKGLIVPELPKAPEMPGAPDTTASAGMDMKAQEQRFAGLALQGSVEAYKAEIARVGADDQIATNTQQTAQNTARIARAIENQGQFALGTV